MGASARPPELLPPLVLTVLPPAGLFGASYLVPEPVPDVLLVESDPLPTAGGSFALVFPPVTGLLTFPGPAAELLPPP